MTGMDILDFCKKYNVEVTMRYDAPNDSYTVRLQRDNMIAAYYLSSYEIGSSKRFDGSVKAALQNCLHRINQLKEVNKNGS